jgi:hypothetical protein
MLVLLLLSTNSTLSNNNLNATSTTIFTNLNSPQSSIPGYGAGDASQTYVPGCSAFTVKMRSSTTQITFNRRLFTIMPDGNITTLGNIDCGGGNAINGPTGFPGNTSVNAANLKSLKLLELIMIGVV